MAKRKDPYIEFLKKDFGELFESLDIHYRQKHFLRSRWLDQILWMEKKASACRGRHQSLRLISIIFGVIVPILLGVETNNNATNLAIKRAAMTLSGVVVITSSIEEFFNYGERWYHYRRTVETLKAHGWQYIQLTGAYQNYADHTEAFTPFADHVEDIIQRDVEVNVTQANKQTKGKAQQPSGNKLPDTF